MDDNIIAVLFSDLEQPKEQVSGPLAQTDAELGTPVPASFGVRFPLSVIDRMLLPLRHQLLPIDMDQGMDLAERRTGLHDYGGEDFLARISETFETLHGTEYSSFGHFALRISTQWHLVNRLRIVELAKQRPDLKQIDIDRPLVITGLFRTGTTYLHNLLAADPGNRAARMWELAFPTGRKEDLLGDVRRRRRIAQLMFVINHVAMPDQSVAHHVNADGYEEDFFLLENAGAILKFVVAFANANYAYRMLDWDMVGPYRFHKLQLQMLSAQQTGERWLLKCPWHLWNLDALMTVYPDARIIQTHRDVAKAIGSHCSLTARLAAKMRRNLTMEEVGQFWVRYSRIGVDRGMRARAHIPKSQVYDVRLKDLRANPLGVIRDLYGHFELEYDERLAQRFRDRIAEDPTLQHGEHEYDIEDFGVSADQVRQDFALYSRRFGV